MFEPGISRTLRQIGIAWVILTWMNLISGPESVASESRMADAAQRGDWSAVRELIGQAAAVNGTQVDGMTTLHWAVFHDHVETVKRLLAAHADVNAKNRYGVTPLSIACVNGTEQVVSALIDAGSDIHTTLRGGETALMTAARTGRLGPVQALLKSGANVNAQDRKGQTALMWAADDGHVPVVEALIKAGADINVRVKSGFTPLLFAAREGQIGVVRALLAAGADVNDAIHVDKANGKSPRHGTSALILAVENGHFELAAELLNAGANPNDSRTGFTPLHTLTWVRKPSRGDGDDGQPPPEGTGNMSSLQFARLLVQRGADVNARIERGAAAKARVRMAGVSPFLLASKTADVPYMKVLVDLGAQPLLPNIDGCTPLLVAAGVGTFQPTEEAGTEDEAIEAVEYLLTLGADINTVDQNGETAMHGAAYKSLPKMVKLLSDKGAKIEIWNQKNKYQWTPLLIAEGFRAGNFKPSAETIVAVHQAMRAAGVTPPPLTPRPPVEPKGYDAN